ncbi:MAG: 50S ribosomal protein L11 methyltransferase [Paludibacter sp.]|nr:50S ribosomal protein L11 methyltransferase [Paludibacter sp.]
MNYIEVKFSAKSEELYIFDLLASYLGEIGFESFEEINDGILAYIDDKLFDEELMVQLVKNFPYANDIEYKIAEIKQVNWNEEWEKNFFEPIIIGNECLIHSTFHKNLPKAKYDIIIDPKMAFGTGHHETTSLMIAEILKMDLEGKSVLDMGCGTAVLAILAAMRGAKPVTAIDIDTWCIENSIENIEKNGVGEISVQLGDASLLEDQHYDIIIANINRNILLSDIKKYSACLSKGGALYMSGFYTEDIPLIEKEANNYHLKLINYNEKNNWVVVETVKIQ